MGRLNTSNINNEYHDLGEIVDKNAMYDNPPLLQSDFGKAKDCTITCLAFIFGKEHYEMIERVAEKHFYNGDTYGTLPITIKSIMKSVMNQLNIKGKAMSKKAKGLLWTYEDIKKIIKKRRYVILTISNDGRDYYINHSVTIIGYMEYTNERFFLVYDNWSTSVNYVDYGKLGAISSINWYE